MGEAMSDTKVTRTRLRCEICRGRMTMAKGIVGNSEKAFGHAIPYTSFTCQNPDCQQSHCFGFLGHTTTVATFGGSWRDRWREIALVNAMQYVGGMQPWRRFWRRRVEIWCALVRYGLGTEKHDDIH